MIYCDTSYLVRLYLDEPGSPEVRALCAGNPVASSVHAQAELPAALHRALREKRIAATAFAAAIAQFEADRAGSAFHWRDLSPRLYHDMAARFATLAVSHFLRAADALHLACAAGHGFTEVYSHDRHFLAAAPAFGLQGLDVLAR